MHHSIIPVGSASPRRSPQHPPRPGPFPAPSLGVGEIADRLVLGKSVCTRAPACRPDQIFSPLDLELRASAGRITRGSVPEPASALHRTHRGQRAADPLVAARTPVSPRAATQARSATARARRVCSSTTIRRRSLRRRFQPRSRQRPPGTGWVPRLVSVACTPRLQRTEEVQAKALALAGRRWPTPSPPLDVARFHHACRVRHMTEHLGLGRGHRISKELPALGKPTGLREPPCPAHRAARGPCHPRPGRFPEAASAAAADRTGGLAVAVAVPHDRLRRSARPVRAVAALRSRAAAMGSRAG